MKIIDLTQPIFSSCPGWPTYKETTVTHETVVGIHGYTSEILKLNTHTATHLDAPFHFFADMKTIDQMPLELFVGEAVIVNLTGVEACHAIGPADLEPYSEKIGKDSIVLFCTGWSKKRGFSKEYYNDWPYLSGEGAEWLLDKGVKGVGIDGMSMGGWYEGTGRPCHEVLLSHEVWLLEELDFPDEVLKYETVELHAVPLKLLGCGGSPCRAYAIVKD
ncbi:MAG: cyclase family protein [Blautia sp.]|nr:cyclase family protein [Blautia sp.]